MKTIEIKEAALKNIDQNKSSQLLLQSIQTNEEKNKINYSDLKIETATPTLGM